MIVKLIGYAGEWLLTILWMPVHVRNFMQARSVEAAARMRAATAAELAANAQVMTALSLMGSDYKPLARHVGDAFYKVYGVRPSDVLGGKLVPLEREQH